VSDVIKGVRFVNWPILFGGYLPIAAAVAVFKIAEKFAFRESEFFIDLWFIIGLLCLAFCIIVGLFLARQLRRDDIAVSNNTVVPILIIISTTACTVHVAFASVASWFERTDPVFSLLVCCAFAIPALALVAVASLARARKMHLVGWILGLDFLFPCASSARALIFLLNNHCTVLWPQNIVLYATPIVLFNLVCLGISVPTSMIPKWPQSAFGLLVTLASAVFAFILTGRIMAFPLDVSADPCRLLLPPW
jgi:hypothetical protein